MKPPRHIVWSLNEINPADPYQKQWYLQQVLQHGNASDIAKLDWEEIKKNLSSFHLKKEIHSLWKRYFNAQR